MEQTHITIKFTPLIENVDEHCTLQIIPEVASVENTGSIDWGDGEHLEYNIPVLHKIIIKKHSKCFFGDNKAEIMNDEPHMVDVESKQNIVDAEKIEVNNEFKEIHLNNNGTTTNSIEGVYSAGDSVVQKKKHQSRSIIETHDFKPSFIDFQRQHISLNNELYRQILGCSTGIRTDRVAFYKQLLRNELMPIRLEIDSILNKCSTISFASYNNMSKSITHSRTKCGSNRFVYTVIAEG